MLPETLLAIKNGEIWHFEDVIKQYGGRVYAAARECNISEQEALALSVRAFMHVYHKITRSYRRQDPAKFLETSFAKGLGQAGARFMDEAEAGAEGAPAVLERSVIRELSQQHKIKSRHSIMIRCVVAVLVVVVLAGGGWAFTLVSQRRVAVEIAQRFGEPGTIVLNRRKIDEGVRSNSMYSLNSGESMLVTSSRMVKRTYTYDRLRGGELIDSMYLPWQYKFITSSSDGEYLIFGGENLVKVDWSGTIITELPIATDPKDVVLDGCGKYLGVNAGQRYLLVDIENFTMEEVDSAILAVNQYGDILNYELVRDCLRKNATVEAISTRKDSRSEFTIVSREDSKLIVEHFNLDSSEPLWQTQINVDPGESFIKRRDFLRFANDAIVIANSYYKYRTRQGHRILTPVESYLQVIDRDTGEFKLDRQRTRSGGISEILDSNSGKYIAFTFDRWQVLMNIDGDEPEVHVIASRSALKTLDSFNGRHYLYSMENDCLFMTEVIDKDMQAAGN